MYRVRYIETNGCQEAQDPAGDILQNGNGCRARTQMAQGAIARGQADRRDGYRYRRVWLAGGYAHLPVAGVTAGTLGGEKLSHPEADRADLVRRVSGANGAAARVHQEDTADTRGGVRSCRKAAEGSGKWQDVEISIWALRLTSFCDPKGFTRRLLHLPGSGCCPGKSLRP